MSSGFENRIRGLAGYDRLLLLLVAGWSILGLPGNYFRVHGIAGWWQLFWFVVTMTMWAAVAGAVAWGVIRRRRRLRDYGFSFQRGGVLSIAIVAVVYAYLAIGGRLVLSTGGDFTLKAVGAFMEEITFRAIAIDTLILLLDGIRAKAFWAILASAALFCLPHFTSKNPMELPGLFVSALVLGYVYYAGRSILLPAWLHGLANSGYAGGLLIAGIYCLLSGADWIMGSQEKPIPPGRGSLCKHLMRRGGGGARLAP